MILLWEAAWVKRFSGWYSAPGFFIQLNPTKEKSAAVTQLATAAYSGMN